MSSEPLTGTIPTLAPMVVVAGPTAGGKSSLAMALALRFSGEIISCDSVAVYREFEIGTAKPSRGDRARVPHHLIDVVDPDAFFTAGDYARRAREAAAEITARGHLPIVCGGTGLYLRAMLDGLFDGPQRDETLRQRLRRRGRPFSLWRLLRRLDAESARRIHPNDEPKLIRAIEVCAASARPLSQLLQEGRDAIQGYRILRMGLSPERSALYRRINERCAGMFEAGLVEETRGLLARYGAGTLAMGSLGYRQAACYLRGECTLAEAVASAQQGHRNYAKRQLTWFRKDWLCKDSLSPDSSGKDSSDQDSSGREVSRAKAHAHWLEDFGDSVVTRASDTVQDFLCSKHVP